ncbi:MAG TPA: hypothetical protein PKX46_02795 [Clostridia bacterium]|nr:hypothetical protein [Clostridia bacterium]
MGEFFTWSSLATYAGATLATTLFTELLKEVGAIKRIPTRLFSYIIAVVLLVLASLFTSGLTLETAALSFVNAVVVSLAANGTFDAVSTKRGPVNKDK